MTTTNAAMNHPVAALIVGFIWLIGAIVFALVLACVYAVYGIGWGAQRGWGWYIAKYRTGGRHRG